MLSTPCIARLKNHFPEATIDMLVAPRAATIVRGHPLLREVKLFDKRGQQSGIRGLWRMAQELRREQYDLALSLHKSYRSAALLWLARIPRRIGFKEAAAGFLYTDRVSRSDLKHEVMRNAAIMRAFGEEPSPDQLALGVYPPEAAQIAAKNHLAGLRRPVVGLAPGSVWLTKRWTEQGFAELTKRLLSSGASVVLLGGPEDQALGDFIAANRLVGQLSGEASEADSSQFRNLIGKTSLAESAALISACDVLVTNDSAPLHLASAAKIPTVALFCATIPEFGFGPWLSPHVILGVENLACRPCGSHGGNSCPTGTHACRVGLLPQQVFDAVYGLLSPEREASQR